MCGQRQVSVTVLDVVHKSAANNILWLIIDYQDTECSKGMSIYFAVFNRNFK